MIKCLRSSDQSISVLLWLLVILLIWLTNCDQMISFKTIYLTSLFFSYFKVEGNGNCLFVTIKKSLQVWHSGAGGAVDGERPLPYYPNWYFRRQIINWMIENRQKVHKYMGSVLKASYGIPDPMASHGGPFSYKTYLTKLMDRSFWGNKVVLWSVSMMWGLKITVVNSKTLQEYRVRHDMAM